MSIVRFIISAAMAIVVTFGLLLLMNALIESADKSLDEAAVTKIADITMPETEIEAKLKEVKPDKPEDPEEPPPDLEQPQVENFELSPSNFSMSVKPSADIKLAGFGGVASDGEYLPIVKVAAIYPRRAQTRGTEGYCTVEYTVMTTGATRNVMVIDCPNTVFQSASIKAAEKFKYKPRVIDGEPVEVAGVRNKFIYELEN